MKHAFDRQRLLRRFAGQTGYALALRVLWAGISFASAVLLARWFSPKDYGNYAAVTSLITFLSVACAVGMPIALVRMLGEFGGGHPTGEQAARARGALRAAHAAALIVSLAAAVLVGAGAVALHFANLAPEPLIYVAGAALLPAMTITDVQGAAARSYGRVVTALAPKDVLWRLLLIPLAFAVTAMAPPDRQLVIFLLLGALILTVLAIGQAWSLYRAVPREVLAAAPVYRLGELARVAASTWITQVAGAVFRSADVVVAGAFLPPRQVGLYFAASRIAALISFVLVSTNLIVGPEVARLHYAGDRSQLTRTLKLASVIIFAPSLLAFIACVTFPSQLLGLFGGGFAEARVELLVLATGQLINAATGCVGIVLVMTGLERKNAEILVTSSVATVALMVVLTPVFGTIGTAVAMSAGMAVSNLRMWLVARRHTDYDPSIIGIFRRSS